MADFTFFDEETNEQIAEAVGHYEAFLKVTAKLAAKDVSIEIESEALQVSGVVLRYTA